MASARGAVPRRLRRTRACGRTRSYHAAEHIVAVAAAVAAVGGREEIVRVFGGVRRRLALRRGERVVRRRRSGLVHCLHELRKGRLVQRARAILVGLLQQARQVIVAELRRVHAVLVAHVAGGGLEADLVTAAGQVLRDRATSPGYAATRDA